MDLGEICESHGGVDGLDEAGGVWQTQTRSKRHRRSTGGTFSPDYSKETVCKISKDEFKLMSTDEKLVSLFEIMTGFGSLTSRVHSLEDNVHSIIALNVESERRIKLLEYRSIDLEARSRRCNLIFRGHPEAINNDDCEAIIKSFLSERLGIDGVFIQRAHRLGALRPTGRKLGQPFSNRNSSRPIIVCFRDYSDVERILSNAKKLRDTNFSINRDFPPEIVNARSNLWAEYKQQKSKRPGGSVYIGFPAKLVVGGKVIRDEFLDWKEVLKESRAGDRRVKPLDVRGNRAVIKDSAAMPKSLFTHSSDPVMSQSILKPSIETACDSDIETVMLSEKSDSESESSVPSSADRQNSSTLSPPVNSGGITPGTSSAVDEYSHAMRRLESTSDRVSKSGRQTSKKSITLTTPPKVATDNPPAKPDLRD